MDKLFKGFLLFTAAVLSISNTNAFDEAYEKDPRRAMLDPQRAILDNTPKQSFERQIQPPGVSTEGFLRRGLSSDNSVTDEVQPLESVLTILKEGPSSGSSSSSLSPSSFPSPSPSPQLARNSTPKLPPSPSPQPQRNSTPKLPTSPSPQPLRETSSPASVPDVSRVASQTDQLTRSLSSLSLSSGSASPVIFRASEDLLLPKSPCLVLERYLLSEEFLKNPDYKPLSNAVEKKNKTVVEPALLKWLVETQAFWARFNSLFQKFECAARDLREKQEAVYSDASSIEHDSKSESSLESPLQTPAPAVPRFLSMPFLSEYNKTPEQKRAENIERAQKKLAEAEAAFRDADAAFRDVEREARRRHPTFSFEYINKKLARGLLARGKPDVLYRPYGKNPSEFKKPEYFLAFVLDPLDLKITLFRHSVRIERLINENEALGFLLSIYKRELLNRVEGWGQVSCWKDWYNLNGNDGPLNVMKRLLIEAYPFTSRARYKRDLSSAQGIAIAALNRDALGLVLWEACLKHIRRIKAPYNHVQVTSLEAERVLNDQYRLLPKHFNSDAPPVGLPIASVAPSFQTIYEGPDYKIPDDEGLQGLVQTSYKIDERKYVNSEGAVSIFIPMKDAHTKANEGKTKDEYHSLTTQLRIAKDVVATVGPSDVLITNPLVEKWKEMPNKFAVMAREFRTYSFMGHHRELWVSVLRELHAKHNPTLIGYGEGLIRPNEPKPTDDQVKYNYDFTQVKKNQELTRTLESLLETNRNLWKDVAASPGMFSSLPRAQEFVVYTRPERPYTQGSLPSKPSENLEIIRLDSLGIHDEELRAKYRTPEGLKGIFHNVQELTLGSNELVSPPLGIDLRSLTALNVSSNKLGNLNFLNGLWGQLVTLHASNNLITEFPSLEGVVNPTLLDLDISSNHMGSLGSIARLTLLRALNISGSNVRTLAGLRTLTNLEILIADGCGLTGAWEGVTPPLSNLTTLSLNLNIGLVLLPYLTKKVSGSEELAINNEKFIKHFPKLRVFREQRELRATQHRPITLSDLRGIVGAS